MFNRKQKLPLRVWGQPPVDPELEELRKRNAARAAEARDKLGARYILHPDNQGATWGWKQQ